PIMSKHMKNNAFPKKGKIAISTRTHNAKRFTIVYQYTLQRTNKSMDDWRINTYNTIIQAYRNRKAEFEDRLAAKKAAETGSVDFGTNPALKKEIIDHEMKKNVISIFRGNHFEDIGAISKGPEEEPQIDI
ncbi:MAG: hypothetical protein GWN01_14360, partial [Nitrosopumilaceae archaeon]|nr:hypothetical protein [Nitrosopumilaceae archaeon]NIU88449.1 hypothetical protein [Nitrosopumilaceae archaeon]NIV66696.1 hypothetical protein [Nitrosopumilaceae archaeon]NIX62641.1 hypothetical protein [Nitrosopumilaceae archaeon]